MKRIIAVVFLLLSAKLFSQDVNVLLKEATNLERLLKEDLALEKYKQILAVDRNNVKALVKSSELSAAVGARQKDEKTKIVFYNQAKEFADKAIAADSNSADAYYVRAVAAGKLTGVEEENKKIVAQVRDIKTYADKALKINPEHGKANYILGKWNYEILNLSWAKKAATKLLFGGMPPASIENAFKYMEKCRKSEPYFVPNFLDLAKAYKFDHKPAQAIAVLNELVKLPTRSPDDVALKAEGKTLLAQMQ